MDDSNQADAPQPSAGRGGPTRSLDPKLLERILLQATTAPSEYNLQPWRFLVVRDERNRRRLRAASWNRPEIDRAPVVLIVLAHHFPFRTHLEPMLEQAIAAGSCSPEKAAEIRGRAVASLERPINHELWATRSTMLAAARLMWAAESLGVSSTMLEGSDALRPEFGIPDDHSICCLIALGHEPAPDPTPGRFGLDEVCFSEHFGQPWRA